MVEIDEKIKSIITEIKARRSLKLLIEKIKLVMQLPTSFCSNLSAINATSLKSYFYAGISCTLLKTIGV